MDERRLSPSRAVDAACDRFEERWRGGGKPDPAEHLDDVPAEERDDLLRELVLLDAGWRRRRGLTVSIDDYISRFPGLDHADLAGELGTASSGPTRFERIERLGAGSFG